jgi:hypothetical protein
MLKTWAQNPDDRPTFEFLHTFFEEYYNMTESSYRQSSSFDSPSARSPERAPIADMRAHQSPARRIPAAGITPSALANKLRTLPGASASESQPSAIRERSTLIPKGASSTAQTNPIIR